ncbi:MULTISPECIES: COP23 domain-containing protein [Moorena]|uniref:Uncharacterized protein n=1 Tax=Moorena producens 3L TaxID=489825 RepID=F4XR87_9CYAN|nr:MULTISPECIES: COP23 domain-containing protein [Moorena]EGJ32888.1 hypothetical protein LYNGBM3L_60420 [Moorena producens 3L]NEP65643.1 hypothetical protein [Moorena sp. SIO3A5]NEQ10773.1 hypothetical protein [Moorena sp. SIO4E2]OLT54693.1 hypothetical protein BI334_32795 [Moorena producens 3L]
MKSNLFHRITTAAITGISLLGFGKTVWAIQELQSTEPVWGRISFTDTPTCHLTQEAICNEYHFKTISGYDIELEAIPVADSGVNLKLYVVDPNDRLLKSIDQEGVGEREKFKDDNTAETGSWIIFVSSVDNSQGYYRVVLKLTDSNGRVILPNYPSSEGVVVSHQRTIPEVKFECKFDYNQQEYATIAVGLRTGKRVPPIMIWRTREFGGWTAKRRCEYVTQKLNYRYAQNGYYLKGLGVTHGVIGSYDLVCLDYYRVSCNSTNQLFTLPFGRNVDDYTKQLESIITDLEGKSKVSPIENGRSRTTKWIPLAPIEDYLEEDSSNIPSRLKRPEPELPVCGEFC